MTLLRRALRYALLAVVALVLLFEEWGWEPLANLVARLARLPFFSWLESKIRNLPPWAALATFFAPVIALLPIKLLALFLIGQGHAMMGVAVLVIAKLAGTALVARLFMLTQPALMELAWFARWYPRWKDWKDSVIAQVRATSLWQGGIDIKRRLATTWHDFRKGLSADK